MTHHLSSSDISILLTRNEQFFLYQEIQVKGCISIHNNSNSFNFYRVFKYFFNKHGYNFDDTSKIGFTRSIKIFWNKDYDLMVFFHGATSKILLRDSNYSLDVVMWLKSGKSSISMTEVIITSILRRFDQKTKGFSWFTFNNFGLALDMVLKFYTSEDIVLQIKVRNFFCTNFDLCRR